MIEEAKLSHITEISECLSSSKLKDHYFNEPNYIKDFLTDSINKGELYIYKNEYNEILAFMRLDSVGMLSKFPLLRCIGVKPAYRSKGIGKKLLRHFECISQNNSDKVFLCVSDFNEKAKKLYMESGYQEVGYIKNLYKPGINEYIMCKTLTLLNTQL